MNEIETSASGGEAIGIETAAIFASASPLGINPMGAFPLSLIVLGRARRRHFDETLNLRPKRTVNVNQELDSSRQIEQRTKPGARTGALPSIRHGQSWVTVLATLIALAALFLSARITHDINTTTAARAPIAVSIADGSTKDLREKGPGEPKHVKLPCAAYYHNL
jgi:hypothetical protein